jgi:hypothetical protein
MVVCSFDWELASKFIPLITGLVPIGITWFLYYQWHKQKDKEVVAKFAQELITKDIDLHNFIINKMTTDNKIECQEILKDYYDSMMLFKYLTNLNKDKILLNSTYEIYSKEIYPLLKKEDFNVNEFKQKFKTLKKHDRVNYIRLLIDCIKFRK